MDVSKASDLLSLATRKAEDAALDLRRWSPHGKFASDELYEIYDRLNGALGFVEDLMTELKRAHQSSTLQEAKE
jgi:hypothetical protein